MRKWLAVIAVVVVTAFAGSAVMLSGASPTGSSKQGAPKGKKKKAEGDKPKTPVTTAVTTPVAPPATGTTSGTAKKVAKTGTGTNVTNNEKVKGTFKYAELPPSAKTGSTGASGSSGTAKKVTKAGATPKGLTSTISKASPLVKAAPKTAVATKKKGGGGS